MNEELIEFIEEILSRGDITENDKKLIFEKSEELGVSQDECELLILDLKIQKESGKEFKNRTKKNTSKKNKIDIPDFGDITSDNVSLKKIILGILFYPYGIYLIYQWYKKNKKS